MTKHIIFLLVFVLLAPSMALPQKATVIGDFKVQALYRAAKITWKAKGDVKGEMAVQIMRADTSEEGPYKEIATVNLTAGKKSYEYTDKITGTEAKYYYKLLVKGTDESLGPVVTRPFFSPPAT